MSRASNWKMRKANQKKRMEKQDTHARIQVPKWYRGGTLKCGSNPGSVLYEFCHLFLFCCAPSLPSLIPGLRPPNQTGDPHSPSL